MDIAHHVSKMIKTIREASLTVCLLCEGSPVK